MASGRRRRQSVERLVAVGGLADDVEARVAQGVREHPAHQAGVVGDDDAGGGRGGHSGRT